jgi:hypothetical protein
MIVEGRRWSAPAIDRQPRAALWRGLESVRHEGHRLVRAGRAPGPMSKFVGFIIGAIEIGIGIATGNRC